jgi:hypothetical protein
MNNNYTEKLATKMLSLMDKLIFALYRIFKYRRQALDFESYHEE